MTLIEVLAVVIILGILAVTLTVGINSKMKRAKEELAKTQIAHLVNQLEAYRLDKGRYPTVNEGLRTLTADPTAIWYVEVAKLADPWGRPYEYLIPGAQGAPIEVRVAAAGVR